MQLNRSQRARPAGVAWLDALFALALFGVGLLALLQLLRTDWQTQRQQIALETAMHLAQDLSERLQLNANQAAAYTQSFAYRAAVSPIDCRATPCSAVQLAQWDVAQWRADVQRDLPAGDAAVFAAGAGWWGIVVAWHDPQEQMRTDGLRGSPPCPREKSCWRLWVHL